MFVEVYLLLKSKEKLIFDLKRHLASAQYVCTTADAWSTRGRGYRGVTAHWTTNESMIRHSAALACRRLRGAHTYDVLAESLNDVFTEYNLSISKMVRCVTDNGSNFTKAFREFGIVVNQHSGDDSSDDDDGEDFADVTLESVDQILNEDTGDTAPAIILPPHHLCSSHTLSLLAVTDIPKILAENAALKRIHNSVMAKYYSLWNSAGRSLKSYEATERIAHRTLVRPCPMRWNSMYDALKVLQSLRAELRAICEAVGVLAFKDMELDFINAYVEVLAPISAALDKLQGQSNESMAFMGVLMPTVFCVKQILEYFVYFVFQIQSRTSILYFVF